MDGACSSLGLQTAAAAPDQSCKQARDTCAEELKMNRLCWLDSRVSRPDDGSCSTATASELTACMEPLAADGAP